jgi:ABC-type nickel/cobalt efflux system permease component RcnA
MNNELLILLGTAATIGLVHTLLGPDHYLPFVALSRSRRWSMKKTLGITALCGLGHVGGSIVLGAIGIAAGVTLNRLNLIESTRGEMAAWLLIAFGLVYGTWGLVRAVRNKPHSHVHFHTDGTRHVHKHTHHRDHTHPHEQQGRRLTGWALFVFFVLGPCEPLIPLLMFPAATLGTGAVALVALVFGLVTVVTMMSVVAVAARGLRLVPATGFERYSHAIAGAVIVLCGVAIQLGL